MSDPWPPDGAPPPPPPPPPPPLLGQPPAAPVAYPAFPVGAEAPRLRRLGRLVNVLVVLTGVAALANLVASILSATAVGEAEDYLAGRIDEDAFIDAYTPAVAVGGLQSIVFLAVIVLTIVWLHRVLSNHRALGRTGTWGPGWAIGGWFVPPFVVYVIPYLVLRETWRGSDPDVPLGDERWKREPVPVVITVWWVVYGLAPIVLIALQGRAAISRGVESSDSENLAEAVRDQVGLSFASSALTVVAAIAWITIVRGISARHRRLIGEATA